MLWNSKHDGECEVYTYRQGVKKLTIRPLLEEGIETFIRQPEAISILYKVRELNESSFSESVSPRDPFGLNYYEDGKEIMFKKMVDEEFEGNVGIYYYGWLKDGIKYTDRQNVTTNVEAIDKWKVLISKAYGERGDYPYFFIGKPFIAPPNTCCNMTYLLLRACDSQEIAENVSSYVKTKFFRFLVSIMKTTQNAYKKVYTFVPEQNYSNGSDIDWKKTIVEIDKQLYAKYGLTEEEIAFIEGMIKPME